MSSLCIEKSAPAYYAVSYTNRAKIGLWASVLFFGLPVSPHAQSAGDVLAGPDSTPSLLASDDQEKDDVLDVDLQNAWSDWKASVKDRTGLDFGFDYNALGYTASASPAEDSAGDGAFRLFGSWELAGRGSANSGSLVFKFENRHKFGDVPVTGFGAELGYAG